MTSEIWQNEKRRLADRLHQRLLQGRDAATCREFLGSGMPEIFEILARQHARRHAEEVFYSINPTHVDLPACAGRQSETFRETILAATKISADDLLKICRSAVNLQYNILVAPRATLCHLLFSSANERRRDDTIVIAAGFGDDRPFIKKLVATLNELNSPQIFRDLFDTLTRTTEQAVLRETPISALLCDFKLLMDFESQTTGKTCAAVSSPVLLGMLVERELDALADDLAQESAKASLPMQASWTLAEIESALERFWLVGAPTTVDAANNSDAVHENEVDEPARLAFVEE